MVENKLLFVDGMSQIWNEGRKLIMFNVKSSMEIIYDAMFQDNVRLNVDSNELDAITKIIVNIMGSVKMLETEDLSFSDDKNWKIVYDDIINAITNIQNRCRQLSDDYPAAMDTTDEITDLGIWVLANFNKIERWIEEYQQNRRVHAISAYNLLLQYIQVCLDAACIAEEFHGKVQGHKSFSSPQDWYQRIVKIGDIIADDNPALMLHKVLSKDQLRVILDKLAYALKKSGY